MKIGQRIKEVFDNMPKTYTVQWFADQLHCDRRNIYRIFDRTNIDIQLLLQISRILNHNFFLDIAKTVSESFEDTDSEA